MNYLLDNKKKKNNIRKIVIGILILFLFFYFYTSIFHGFSYALHLVSKPFVYLGKNIGQSFENIDFIFTSKKNLAKENEELRDLLNEKEATFSNYNTLLDENIKIKEILGRIENKSDKNSIVLASILSKPNKSLYDTLILDIGEDDHIKVGDKVFAKGYVPLGKIVEVYKNTSKVLLYSSSKEKTEVIISGKDSYMTIVGRGGGNFEMILPRDFEIENGTEVVLPGVSPHTVAKVETIISDPRDSSKKALLSSPVNIFELKFVQVESE